MSRPTLQRQPKARRTSACDGPRGSIRSQRSLSPATTRQWSFIGARCFLSNHSKAGGSNSIRQTNCRTPCKATCLCTRHPDCLARTRRGSPCQSPAMKNGRCRMHGGPSPGAPKGNKNAYKRGRYAAEAIERRREISALIRAARERMSDEELRENLTERARALGFSHRPKRSIECRPRHCRGRTSPRARIAQPRSGALRQRC
jgi:hypothetical protein